MGRLDSAIDFINKKIDSVRKDINDGLKFCGIIDETPPAPIQQTPKLNSASQKSEEKDAVRVCEEIAKEYNVSSVYVDTALWQYCAEKKFEMCTEANPKCGECKVKNCNNRKK